jgi:hypothetical protein
LGIDFLDLSFHLHRELKVKVDMNLFQDAAMTRTPPDITAEELLRAVHAAKPCCPSCRHDPSTLPEDETCPQCGGPFNEETIWQVVRRLLSLVLAIEEKEITRQSLLRTELGMT